MEEQSFRKRRREQPITIAKHIWPSRGCRVKFRNNKPTREIQAIQKAIEIWTKALELLNNEYWYMRERKKTKIKFDALKMTTSTWLSFNLVNKIMPPKQIRISMMLMWHVDIIKSHRWCRKKNKIKKNIPRTLINNNICRLFFFY